MTKIGETAGFDIAFSEDVSVFTTENLQYNAAVMFFTTGELPMDAPQKAALTGFVRAGGGFIGVHSATDAFYMWPEYRDLIGGWFNEHPWHQKVRIMVGDPADSLVAFLGPSIEIDDEIYQIRDFLTCIRRSQAPVQVKSGQRPLETASLIPLRSRALTTLLAGFASNLIGAFVNGLTPSCAGVAGFSTTTNFANPGNRNVPAVLSSAWPTSASASNTCLTSSRVNLEHFSAILCTSSDFDIASGIRRSISSAVGVYGRKHSAPCSGGRAENRCAQG
jgi:hypothetical protein